LEKSVVNIFEENNNISLVL